MQISIYILNHNAGLQFITIKNSLPAKDKLLQLMDYAPNLQDKKLN